MAPVSPVLNTLVQVEEDQHTHVALLEISYLLTLNTSEKYRLVIHTSDGQQYASDYVPFKITPPIDSLGFSQDSANVAILVSTHDPSNGTRYLPVGL